MNRIDGRAADDLREVRLQLGWAKHAEGSCLIEFGDTMVLCTASLENSVPSWKRGSGSGWVTGEYGMLPRATGKRNQRDAARGKQDGRTIEIQRLIGRSLRAAIDLEALGERTIVLDCDVLQADGGTRCASITGAWVALAQALHRVDGTGALRHRALPHSVAAVSVGIVDGTPLLDLCYAEDSKAEVDMNVVMTGANRLVEVQASGEGATFSLEELSSLLQLAGHGLQSLSRLQQDALRELEK